MATAQSQMIGGYQKESVQLSPAQCHSCDAPKEFYAQDGPLSSCNLPRPHSARGFFMPMDGLYPRNAGMHISRVCTGSTV